MKYQNIHQKQINGCIKGDRRSQMEIYKLYYKAMYNTSYRIINDAMDAEDVMQEAFLSAFNKINTYKGDVSFGAWLKKIVINKSLDAIKKRKTEFSEIDNTVNSIPDSVEDSDLDKTTIKVEQIKAAINNLADGYRIVLSLYLLEGYDHDEIGEILNISSSTSRSQLTRARKKLLDELNKKFYTIYEKN